MKTEKELNEDIMNITMTIMDKYPELSEYLGEMPVTVPNTENPEINRKHLNTYYESLKALLENYIREHPPGGTQ